MLVQAHLDKRQSEMLHLHAQVMAKHDTVMRDIDEKLNALTMRLMRREGLPEA